MIIRVKYKHLSKNQKINHFVFLATSTNQRKENTKDLEGLTVLRDYSYYFTELFSILFN